jgi:RHS repeat-associated protein
VRQLPNGQMVMGRRIYDPSIGRFTTKDPIGFRGLDINLYRYAHNTPIKSYDSTGLIAVVDDVTVITMMLGAVAVAAINQWANSPRGQEWIATTGKNVGDFVENARQYFAKRPGESLPSKSKPGDSKVENRGDGKGTIRDYDENGNAKTDYDFGHNHGAGDPHAHDWSNGERNRGRSLRPEE